MEKSTKKDLKEQYKNRKITGGIFCIKCQGNDRMWIRATRDLEGQKNRYNFFITTDTCPEPAMQTDWKLFGATSFSFEILEEIERKETQSEREFADDIGLLLEIWNEKQRLHEIP